MCKRVPVGVIQEVIIDVITLPHVLRNIVEAEVCVVADNDVRSGNRYVSVEIKRGLKVSRQRGSARQL